MVLKFSKLSPHSEHNFFTLSGSFIEWHSDQIGPNWNEVLSGHSYRYQIPVPHVPLSGIRNIWIYVEARRLVRWLASGDGYLDIRFIS